MDAPEPLTQLRGLVPLLEPITAFQVLDALDYGEVTIHADTQDRRVWIYPHGVIALHRRTGTVLVETLDGDKQQTKPGRTSEAFWTAEA